MARLNDELKFTNVVRYSSRRGPICRTYSAESRSLQLPSAPPSDVSATSATEDERNLMNREHCFITNDPSDAKDCAHLINAVRARKDDLVKQQRKKEVEQQLMHRSIVSSWFSLNHPSNKIYLNPSIHRILDSFGYIALTCDKETLIALKEFYTNVNPAWINGGNQRPFPWGSSSTNSTTTPLEAPRFQLLPLYPSCWLKNGSPLVVFQEVAAGIKPTLYGVSTDNALRELDGIGSAPAASQPALGPFDRRHNRHKHSHNVNPLLVILNAHMHCRRANRSIPPPVLCPDDKDLFELTMEVGELIYARPKVTSIPSDQNEPDNDNDDKDEDEDQDEEEDKDHIRKSEIITFADEMGILSIGSGKKNDDKDKTLTQPPSKRPRLRSDVLFNYIMYGSSQASSSTGDSNVEEYMATLSIENDCVDGHGYETPESPDAALVALDDASVHELESKGCNTIERIALWRDQVDSNTKVESAETENLGADIVAQCRD